MALSYQPRSNVEYKPESTFFITEYAFYWFMNVINNYKT